eukprot:TRINITY_DN15537_c0_g1_i1.p1 TRINITY_DN15537_c0_g1~~TRINITY_DN15537_c0_g1_i1.p1  ORF type:complete len:170 (-),score=26.79 TRINITY_DN15537_c0_g1_i1:127-636(-)
MHRVLRKVVQNAVQSSSPVIVSLEHPLGKAYGPQLAFEKIMVHKGSGMELLEDSSINDALQKPTLEVLKEDNTLNSVFKQSHIQMNTRTFDRSFFKRETKASALPAAKPAAPMREAQQNALHAAAVHRIESSRLPAGHNKNIEVSLLANEAANVMVNDLWIYQSKMEEM